MACGIGNGFGSEKQKPFNKNSEYDFLVGSRLEHCSFGSDVLHCIGGQSASGGSFVCASRIVVCCDRQLSAQVSTELYDRHQIAVDLAQRRKLEQNTSSGGLALGYRRFSDDDHRIFQDFVARIFHPFDDGFDSRYLLLYFAS